MNWNIIFCNKQYPLERSKWYIVEKKKVGILVINVKKNKEVHRFRSNHIVSTFINLEASSP